MTPTQKRLREMAERWTTEKMKSLVLSHKFTEAYEAGLRAGFLLAVEMAVEWAEKHTPTDADGVCPAADQIRALAGEVTNAAAQA